MKLQAHTRLSSALFTEAEVRARARLSASDMDIAEKIASVLTADSSVPMDDDDSKEFHELIKHTLLPGVEAAKQQLEHASSYAAKKIQSWALTHIRQCKILGRDATLFEKLMDNPLAAARQLALHLMGVPTKPKDREDRAVDDLLTDLEF